MEIKQKLVNFFKENFMIEIENKFDNNESFLESSIIDSTGVLELVTFLENNFNIKISNLHFLLAVILTFFCSFLLPVIKAVILICLI